MEVVFIDLGSYSVKFLRGSSERKIVRYLDFHENIIEKSFGEDENKWTDINISAFNVIEAIQFKLIKEYLEENPSVEKVIINLPSHYSTLRFITLPVKNRKKIEQMIPFQLEGELPYPSLEGQLAIFPIITQKGSYTLCSSVHTKDFDHFFQEARKLTPPVGAIIGLESIYQTFALEYNLSEPIAIIDLGHSKSVCYLFYNKRLVGVETSFVCGQVTDEMIAQTYKISREDAISFKHKNAFFLTDEEFEKADEDQKNFSLLMKKVFSNFVDDFKRWGVGYQLKTRQEIQKVFITGGMSNIKSINKFLTHSLDVQVDHVNFLHQSEIVDLALSPKKLRSLTNNYGLSYHITAKNGLSNFCNGHYTISGENDFPLESISFIGVRMAFVCLILCVVMIFENIHLARFDKKISQKVSDRLKDPAFEITPRQRRKLIRNPSNLLSFMEGKDQRLNGQITILKEMAQIDGLAPMAELGRTVDHSQDVELVSFENKGNNIKAIFKSGKVKALMALEGIIKAKSFHNTKTVLWQKKKALEISYKNEK